MSATDVLKMKVADLKRELKMRGLSTIGNKTELQERLQTALLDGDLSLEDAAISEELLDDVLTDEEEKAVLELPQEEKNLLQESKAEIKQSFADNVNQQTKKIVLKRKNSITVPTQSSGIIPTAKENAVPADKIEKTESEDVPNDKDDSVDSKTEAKKVKMSELTMKERLEMRAKKFGTIGDPVAKSFSHSKRNEELQQIEALKKRAERFGCVLSSKIAEIDKQEKLQKRQERFGAASNSSSKSSRDIYAEKARLRLERFKAK